MLQTAYREKNIGESFSQRGAWRLFFGAMPQSTALTADESGTSVQLGWYRGAFRPYLFGVLLYF